MHLCGLNDTAASAVLRALVELYGNILFQAIPFECLHLQEVQEKSFSLLIFYVFAKPGSSFKDLISPWFKFQRPWLDFFYKKIQITCYLKSNLFLIVLILTKTWRLVGRVEYPVLLLSMGSVPADCYVKDKWSFLRTTSACLSILWIIYIQLIAIVLGWDEIG